MDGIVVTVVGMAVMEATDGMVVTVTGNMIKSNLEFLFICLGKFHDYTDSWG
jgi:hypothetical protein